jgi:anti-sigma factor RsiW
VTPDLRDPRDPEPDHWRLQMMAFLDDELDEPARREFVNRCYADPQLAAELASFKKVADVASSMRLREPEDYETERFFARVSARVERGAGFVLLAAGGALVGAWSLYRIFTSGLDMTLKVGLAAGVLGFALVVLSVARLRRRTRRLDRYQGVRR